VVVPKLEFENRRGKKQKMPVRLVTNGHLNCKSASLLLPNHGRAEEAKHLIDLIRDRISAAAGEKQSDRTRIGATSSTINEPISVSSSLLRAAYNEAGASACEDLLYSSSAFGISASSC